MKNDFAELLHKLIHEAGIKMINISLATGYDLSYISKWMSGKMLPSEKNIRAIVRSVAECIICASDGRQVEGLLEAYGSGDREGLQLAMEEALLLAYSRSKGVANKRSIDLHAHISIREILQRVEEMNSSGAGDYIAIADLFRLDRDSRLEFAGIYNGRYETRKHDRDAQVTIVTCIDDPEDVIYDCLYLLHLISICSRQRLSIYNSRVATGKFLYIADRSVSVSGIVFPQDRGCTAVSIVDDPETAGQLHQAYMQQVNTRSMMLQPMDIRDFMTSRSYIKSMFSEDNRWLIGHVTEQLLPRELFEELLQEIHVEDPAEYRSIHEFAQGIIQHSPVRIMLYETTISDLLATGEVDFFNHKLRFNSRQMKMFLEYLMQLNASDVQFRMIKGGFSVHFEHLYNPCLFISGTSLYMRLENAYDRESILICIDPDVKQLIGRFFEQAWSERPDVVVEDETAIARILTHYCTMNSLLNNLEES